MCKRVCVKQGTTIRFVNAIINFDKRLNFQNYIIKIIENFIEK